MRPSDETTTRWRKSSRSNGGGDGNCVEVAELGARIGVRDSKNPAGPALTIARAQWSTFARAWFGPGERS